ncbi:hypothetical protein AAEU33_20415 [Chryseobacterium sp. Chry.R1]|uniref:hypothetical protein n=1 Tax=Chryseobacterium sp. Chry.R1 TaxID=3139392 RepID=UPI0031F784E7
MRKRTIYLSIFTISIINIIISCERNNNLIGQQEETISRKWSEFITTESLMDGAHFNLKKTSDNLAKPIINGEKIEHSIVLKDFLLYEYIGDQLIAKIPVVLKQNQIFINVPNESEILIFTIDINGNLKQNKAL